MLTTKDYEDALFVQDACNLSGVVRSWARVTARIWEEARDGTGQGTDWVNTHPINVLYASKVASLTGCETPLTFCRAYEACKRYTEAA